MKAIKKSFHLFEPRGINENLDVELFEKESNIKLPVLFKEFLKSFHIDKVFPEVYFLSKFKDTFGSGRLYYIPKIEDLFLGEIFDLEKGLDVRNRLYSVEDEVFSYGYFPFGQDSTGHFILMVGIGTNNLEKIYVESPDESFQEGERFTLLANNIFEFIRGFEYVEREKLSDDIKYNQLYRNWGEDFWRVREEGQDSSSSEHSVK
ncbi:SMI1/KNR4 family protein [Runella zeae]|uniref:SMI1/KNR4 family protein n=1 Tax=Runella zeae TaxID=94255 RepID=UPI00041E870F|nr:SMI1/KNR4 family protein [Runella zeae]